MRKFKGKNKQKAFILLVFLVLQLANIFNILGGILKKEKLVSVLIPTYNVEKFIKLSINSIINQTYKNLEIIIIDDCSTDNTFNILEKMSLKDSRIKLFKNDNNLKICKTLNKAFSMSKGDYIVRMDGDDISKLDKIERQINYLEKNMDIGLVGVSIININEDGKEISRNKYRKDFSLLKKLLRYGTPVLHIWAARREIYIKLGGYRETLYVEDYDFLSRMVTEGYKFSNLENYYGYYVRMRDGNTVSTNGIRQIKAFEYVKKLYIERLNTGNDTYTKENFDRYIKTNEQEEKKFEKALFYFKNYLKFKYKKSSLIFLMKSAFSSHYLTKALINRFIFKKISKM